MSNFIKSYQLSKSLSTPFVLLQSSAPGFILHPSYGFLLNGLHISSLIQFLSIILLNHNLKKFLKSSSLSTFKHCTQGSSPPSPTTSQSHLVQPYYTVSIHFDQSEILIFHTLSCLSLHLFLHLLNIYFSLKTQFPQTLPPAQGTLAGPFSMPWSSLYTLFTRVFIILSVHTCNTKEQFLL